MMRKKTLLLSVIGCCLCLVGASHAAAAPIFNTPGASAVPEPHVLGFFAAALTALAWAGRRRK